MKNNYFKAKFDEGKLRWDLLDLKLIEPIVAALTYGLKDHEEHSWKTVPDAKERYYAAFMRHFTEYRDGEEKDKESGLPHLYHALCNLYFLIYFDKQERVHETKK